LEEAAMLPMLSGNAPADERGRRTEIVKKLALIANCAQPRMGEVLKRFSRTGKALGLKLFADRSTARLLKTAKSMELEKMFEAVDAVVALGGDGTMLRVIRELDGRDKPIIGVKIGGLGFLTSVSEDDVDRALRCLARDEFTTGIRAILDCRVERKGRTTASYRALNDIVVSNGPSPRVVTLDVSIDGDNVTSYVCDGLIVSTPTGSTGHSLSAGGPILTPETPAFVISLICPHTLSSRPLVVPDNSEVSVLAVKSGGAMRLSVDGQVGQTLVQGDCIRIGRSRRNVQFIHLPGHSYFSVLRQKLHWSGSSL
jgi:NAD+ kinase